MWILEALVGDIVTAWRKGLNDTVVSEKQPGTVWPVQSTSCRVR